MSALAALHLARRVTGLFPQQDRPWVALLFLSSLPVAYTLFFGQPMLLLACAVAEGYLAFRAGREFRGGLWVACLLFKPQYGLLFAPLLIWKRRWAAVAGAAAGVLAIVIGSILVAGMPALLPTRHRWPPCPASAVAAPTSPSA